VTSSTPAIDYTVPVVGVPVAPAQTRRPGRSLRLAAVGVALSWATGCGGRTGSAVDAAGVPDGGSALPLALFNGLDFSGWQTYLGPPYGATEPQGLDDDPRGVFSIVSVEGAPAIRVSGEVWGALTTLQEFEDYHLSVEFKWGTHPVWPPLTFRDSGVMYHSVGPFGAVKAGGGVLADPPGSGYFMTSMELQIAQDDVGSYAALGPIPIEGGAFGVAASGQHENPPGQWNKIEIFVVGNESVHVVNGVPVAHLRGATLAPANGSAVALVRGRIQLQSESMEILFRAITLEPIERIPAALVQ
jgi:hypothetical protein